MWWRFSKPPEIDHILSLERIETYLAAANENRQLAYKLYELNMAASECLYPSMQMLEIALRNRFHECLSSRFGDDWYDLPGVITTIHQRRKISDAKIGLVEAKKPITGGRVVASLTFGFWTACLGNNYEEQLWRPALHLAFPKKPKDISRRAINSELTPIRMLRNRIAHHEPVLYWNLPKHHEKIMKVLGWLSPEAQKWVSKRCRFNSVYDAKRAMLFKRRNSN